VQEENPQRLTLEKFQSLVRLDLSRVRRPLSDDGLRCVVKAFPALRSLSLAKCARTTRPGSLSSPTPLRSHLASPSTPPSPWPSPSPSPWPELSPDSADDDHGDPLTALGDLVELELGGNWLPTDRTLQALAMNTRLKTLRLLGGCALLSAGLAPLGWGTQRSPTSRPSSSPPPPAPSSSPPPPAPSSVSNSPGGSSPRIASDAHRPSSANPEDDPSTTHRGLPRSAATAVQPASLTSLSLAWCYEVTDEWLQTVGESLPSLTALDLARCSSLTDRGAAALAPLPHLLALDLSCIRSLTDAAVEAIVSHHRLTALSLASCR